MLLMITVKLAMILVIERNLFYSGVIIIFHI